MPIPVTCECGKQYTLSRKLIGKKVSCKECGQVFRVARDRPPTKPKSADSSTASDAQPRPTIIDSDNMLPKIIVTSPTAKRTRTKSESLEKTRTKFENFKLSNIASDDTTGSTGQPPNIPPAKGALPKEQIAVSSDQLLKTDSGKPKILPPPLPKKRRVDWFYSINEQSYGPVELSKLVGMIRNGELACVELLVWNENFADWKSVDDVTELQETAFNHSPPERQKNNQHKAASKFVNLVADSFQPKKHDLNRGARSNIKAGPGKKSMRVEICLVVAIVGLLLVFAAGWVPGRPNGIDTYGNQSGGSGDRSNGELRDPELISIQIEAKFVTLATSRLKNPASAEWKNLQTKKVIMPKIPIPVLAKASAGYCVTGTVYASNSFGGVVPTSMIGFFDDDKDELFIGTQSEFTDKVPLNSITDWVSWVYENLE